MHPPWNRLCFQIVVFTKPPGLQSHCSRTASPSQEVFASGADSAAQGGKKATIKAKNAVQTATERCGEARILAVFDLAQITASPRTGDHTPVVAAAGLACDAALP